VTLDDRVAIERSGKTCTLIGHDSKPYESPPPGALGGHRAEKVYGRLDCPSALRRIPRGRYVRLLVSAEDAVLDVAAGYRPRAVCILGRTPPGRLNRRRGGTPPTVKVFTCLRLAWNGHAPALRSLKPLCLRNRRDGNCRRKTFVRG
jgi:hypothetical protein